MTCKEALQLLLDQCDYQSGACAITEMVGAVIPPEVLVLCREAVKTAPAPK